MTDGINQARTEARREANAVEQAIERLDKMLRQHPIDARVVADGGMLIREVDRLQAIVKHLPVCSRLVGEGDARRLVQDVPVVPGMDVWRVWPATEYIPVQVTQLAEPYPTSAAGIDDCNLNRHPAEDCYDSPEAAEFAAEAAKGATDG